MDTFTDEVTSMPLAFMSHPARDEVDDVADLLLASHSCPVRPASGVKSRRPSISQDLKHALHKQFVSHHHHHHKGSCLWDQLFQKATVVTMEEKYKVVAWASEFYCTLTSIFFALPLMIYLDPPHADQPLSHLTHLCILLSVATAAVSAVYHATNYKIWSTMDAYLATAMFYLKTLSLMASLPPILLPIPDHLHYLFHHILTPYLILVVLGLVFLHSWRQTALLSACLMAAIMPVTIYAFIIHEAYKGLFLGLLGIALFGGDRAGIWCGHPAWHIVGGWSLWWGIWVSARGL